MNDVAEVPATPSREILTVQQIAREVEASGATGRLAFAAGHSAAIAASDGDTGNIGVEFSVPVDAPPRSSIATSDDGSSR